MKKLIIASLFILTICACYDLDEDPRNVLNPEFFFETPDNVEMAVLGTYGLITSEKLYGRKLTLSLQLRSDMCDIGNKGSERRVQVNEFTLDAQNGMVAEIWPQAYKVIGAANAAIYGAESLSSDHPEWIETLDVLKAEARFVRAFTYYHLVRLFGNIPYIDFYVSNPDLVKDMSQSTSQEVYDGIISDLKYARTYLPNKYPSNTRARATKGTAAAYLASVYLTLGSESGDQVSFEKAYNEAKYVIDSSSLFGYGLMDDFKDLFDGSNADGLKEHILVFDFLANVQGTGSQNEDFIVPVNGIIGIERDGWSVSVPSIEVYDNWDALDYRKKISFDDFVIDSNGDTIWYDSYEVVQRPHIAKYSRFGNGENIGARSDNNYVGMRYAEVLLIAAEAGNEVNGPVQETIDLLNKVRERARNWNGTLVDFPADIELGITKEELRILILEERRLELAFEFKRWYDIKRRRLENYGDLRVFTDTITSLEPHVKFTDRDYLFPLPQDELDRNPNLTQNPGY